MKKIEKSDVLRIDEMTKDEFLAFFDSHFAYWHVLGGFMVELKDYIEEFYMCFMQYDKFKILKNSEEYNELIKKHGEEKLHDYEKHLKEADKDFWIRYSFYSLETRVLYMTCADCEEIEINNKISELYKKHERKVDDEALYSARHCIKEKALETMKRGTKKRREKMKSKNMYFTELSPIQGQQKSFYSKAKIRRNDDGSETLYSYNTPIIKRDKEGKLWRIWDGYSMTTGRHIRAFCGLNKKQFDALEYERR